jgi:hypothetical protein
MNHFIIKNIHSPNYIICRFKSRTNFVSPAKDTALQHIIFSRSCRPVFLSGSGSTNTIKTGSIQDPKTKTMRTIHSPIKGSFSEVGGMLSPMTMRKTVMESSVVMPRVTCRVASLNRGRILGRNWDKSVKSFPPLYSQSHQLTPPPPPSNSGLKLVCTVMQILYTESSSLRTRKIMRRN